MASYMVLTPPGGTDDPDRILIVKDGFSVFAFVLPLVFMLWHRMWLFAVLLVLFELALGFGLEASGQEAAGGIIQFALSLLIALESGSLRSRHLQGKGYRLDAILTAGSLGDAEEIYFSTDRDAPAAPDAPMLPLKAGPSGGLALGLFDMNKER